MDELTKEQLGAVEELERALGITSGFFRSLYNDDDWSFVIKMQAFIESAATRLIESLLATTPEVARFLGKLNLVGGAQSKLRLLEALGHLERFEDNFVRGLAKIRNVVVHDIRSISFKLSTYVSNLSEAEADSFVISTCGAYFDEKSDRTERAEFRKAVLANPKHYLWLCGLYVAGCMSLRIDTANSQVRIAEANQKILQLKLEHAERQLAAMQPALTAEQLHAIAAALNPLPGSVPDE